MYRDNGFANVDAQIHKSQPVSKRHRAGGRRSFRIKRERACRRFRAHRNPRQHQDARQGDPARDGESPRASCSSETAPRSQSRRRITVARLLRARGCVHGADERLGTGQDQRERGGYRETDRHLPGRRRLLEHRELHRHRAGAAGQPLRSRADRWRSSHSPSQRPETADRHPLHRALPSWTANFSAQHQLVRSVARVQSSSRSRFHAVAPCRSVIPISSARSAGVGHLHAQEQTMVDTSTTTSTFFGTASAVSVFHATAASPTSSTTGITSSIRPTRSLWTGANNRLFPDRAACTFRGSTEVSDRQRSAAENEFIAPQAHKPVSTIQSAENGWVIKFNIRGRALVTSPDSKPACPCLPASSLAGSLDLRGYRLRSVGPRLPLKSTLAPTRTAAADLQNGANIGGNLMLLPEPRVRVPHHSRRLVCAA